MNEPNETPTYATCEDCNGTGNISEYDDFYQRCPTCKGKGWTQE